MGASKYRLSKSKKNGFASFPRTLVEAIFWDKKKKPLEEVLDGKIDQPLDPAYVGKVPQVAQDGTVDWVVPLAGSTADSAMSGSSTNAPQNKVVKQYVDTVDGKVSALGHEVGNNASYLSVFSQASVSGSIEIGSALFAGKKYHLHFDLSADRTFPITLRSADGSSGPITQTIADSQLWKAGHNIVSFTYSSGTYLRFGASGDWSFLSNIVIYSDIHELFPIHEKVTDTTIKTIGRVFSSSDYSGIYCSNYGTGAVSVARADGAGNSYLIPVEGGEKYFIESTELRYPQNSFAFYNGVPDASTFVQPAITSSGGLLIVPAGAKYLLITINPTLAGTTRVIGYGSIDKDCLPESLGFSTERVEINTMGKKFGESDYYGSYCGNYGTGRIDSANATSNSFLIPVKAGEKYIITGTNWKYGQSSFQVYSGTPSTSTFVQTIHYTSGIMTIPSSGKYLLIDIDPTLTNDTEVVGYSSINKKCLPDALYSFWSGKKLLAIGDSMTDNTNNLRWQDHAGPMLGMNVTTHAKGGISAIAMVDGDNNGFPALTSSDVADKDLIAVMGFYNERGIASSSPGDADDMYPTNNTFCGRVNYVISKIFSLLKTAGNLKCRVIIIGAHKYGKYTWSNESAYDDGNKISEYAKLVADEQSLHFVDLNANGGVNRFNWDVFSNSNTPYNPNYIPADGVSDGTNKPFSTLGDAPAASGNNGKFITVSGVSGCYLSDGTSWNADARDAIWNADQLHLGADGFKLIAEVIAGSINSIMRMP